MSSDNKKKRPRQLPRVQSGFEDLLIEMIEKRTGAEFDMFLYPQVSTCANCWLNLQNVGKQLADKRDWTDLEIGSMGQQKTVVNPLVPYYLKLQAELRLQFEALGLNYRATPAKITESTKKGGDTENDPLLNALNAIK